MKSIHMMGVLGSGMSGIAKLASKAGFKVTGCDLKLIGHSKKHLEGIDYLIVTPAVFYQSKVEPELVLARKKNIVLTWQEFLGKELTKNKKVIAIAGTHGKSTTTAMLSKILIDNKFDPSVVMGAYVPEWKGNSRFGKGEYFVIEADEFNDNFLNYYPSIIVINNIEFDHPDYFKDENSLRESFEKFKGNLVGEKILITQEDSKNIKFNLKVFGEHNQKNANMAYLVAEKLGIDKENIIKSIESFKGIGRRMELIGIKQGIKVYDDYAHHPTAIKTTLEGLRIKSPKSKILAIVEPHGYKRTRALLPLYKNCFQSVDKVIVGPIFKSRDKSQDKIDEKEIIKVSNHKDIVFKDSLDKIIKIIEKNSKSLDIIIVMGAGESNLWAKQIIKYLDTPSFKNLTTLKIGGKIKYFKEVFTRDELINCVKFAKSKNLPIFVIGSGSDILASDNNFNGLVIKYSANKIKLLKNMISADAGVLWDDLVKFSVENNLQGIERLSGIPGTVGAAPIQNIGAYGQEISDTFFSLEAFDINKLKFKRLFKKDCKFGYRESIFKTKKYWQKYVIINVILKLKLNKSADLEKIRNETLTTRKQKLDDPDITPNAGSFFINPFIDKEDKERLEKIFDDIRFYPVGDKFKISAGFLIEKAGWKGKNMGKVKVSDKHALVLTNPSGKGNFSDLKKLADAIINDVYKKYKIKLIPEVQYINV